VNEISKEIKKTQMKWGRNVREESGKKGK